MSSDTDIDLSTSSDDTADGRWMGYDDLSALRRIDRPSAIKLATRKKWERRKNNAGLMQVLVPVDWLSWAERRRDRYGDSPPADVDMSAAVSVVKEAYEIAIQAKDAEISALRGQVGAHEALLAAARLQVQDARVEAQEAKSAVTRAELAAGAAQERVQQMEAAEAARKGQGLWRRLREAWRGG